MIKANIPVLPSRELARSAAFYSRLGYDVVRRHADYLILSCGEAELHVALMDVDPGKNPAGVYLRAYAVDEIARALGKIAENKPWGQREFSVSDPDENLLRVGEASSH